jgi:PAS domain S-box-containing protein
MCRLQRNIKIRLNVVFLYFILLWLIGFSLPIFAAAKPELEKVSLQLKWQHQFQFAGYYAAKEKGFYAAEGLDVDIKQRSAKVDNIEQVLQGESEYGISDTSLLLDRLNNKPVVMLATIFQHNPLVYISLKSSGIVSPYEMKGKKVMDDTSARAPLLAMLYETGIATQESTHLEHSFDINDLLNGEVDVMAVYLTDQPDLFRQRKIEINIIDPRNYGIDFLGDNLFTTEQQIRQHPERTKRFLHASLKGWDYALKHPEEIIQLILKKYNSDKRLSAQHLRFEAAETAKMILPDFIPLGSTNIERFQRIAETYQQLEMVKSVTNLEGFIYQHAVRGKLKLTQEEHAWLQAHPVIRLGIDSDFAPYEWSDNKDNHLGMSADYIKLIEQCLGVRVEVIKNKPWTEILSKAQRGEIDMLAALNKTSERDKYLSFTSPYAETPAVIINHEKNGFLGSLKALSGKRVAIEQSYFMHDHLAFEHPEIHLLLAKSTQEALLMVNSGQADAYIGDASVANYAIRKAGMINLMYSGDTGYKSQIRMAATKSNPLLAIILEKALQCVPEFERQAIQNRWMSLPVKAGINTEEVIIYAIVALAVFLLAVAWNISLQREIKRREQIAEALKNSEEQFKSLFTQAPLGIALIDSITGQIYKANQKYADIVGLPAKELECIDWMQMIHTDDVQAHLNNMTLIKEGKTNGFSMEKRYLRPDGTVIWVNLTVASINIDHKHHPCHYCIVEDISERKRKEIEYQAIIQGSLSGFWCYDPYGRLLAVNQALCKMLGYSEQELLNMTIMDIEAKESHDEVMVHIQAVKEKGHDLFETQHRRKDGRIIDVEVNVLYVEALGQRVFVFINDISERKRMEMALRNSHDELLHYFEQPLIGMMTSSLEKKTLNVNQCFCDMLGYSKQEMLALNWAKLTHPDDLAKNEAYFAQALRHKLDSYEMEKRYIHKDGHIVHAHLAVNCVYDAQRQLKYVIGMVLDITARKKIEVSLRQSEGRFRTFFQQSADATMLLRDDVIVDCNQACLNLFQVSREQFIGKPPIFFSPEYQPDGRLSAEVGEDCVNKGKKHGSVKFEWLHRRLNGSEFWVEAATTLIDIDGKPTTLAVLRDISERKQAETELLIAAKVFEAHEGIIVASANGLILKVNQAFSQITGYSSEEVIGKNPRFLSSGRQNMYFYAQLWKSVYQTGSWQGEVWNKRKNGEVYPEWLTITAVMNHHDQLITHYVAIFRDITERKKVEKAMQEAEEKATLASQAKSEFLANMSHEIRTPMNAIMGMLHLAQRTELTCKQRNYLNKIDYATQSLLTIIDDILDFSKIEAGKLELENTVFSLTEILDYVTDIIDLKAKQKNIDIIVSVSQQTPLQLIGDSLRLTQILINLVSNAVKFTSEGKVVISVKPKNLNQQQVYLLFSVEDSGIGISPEQIPSLFLPFSQADSSITRKYGGSGLGLVICKQLVELMGGEIAVESQQGKGSTFSFAVNLGVSSQEALTVKRKDIVLRDNFNGRRVLLVEDNEINRELAIELLRELGIQVEIAENGNQAIEHVQNENFDLVLMDIQMPEMDGLTATRKIRENGKLRDLPIVAMTAHAMSGDREKSLMAGMNDHLTKPVDLQKLMEVLSYWLAEKPQQPSASNPTITANAAEIEAEFPKELPGFDIPAALLRVRGNTKLLRKVLSMFYRDYKDGAVKLRQLVDSDNYQEATRFVHTLKGVAAHLEAKELLSIASQAEQIFINGEMDKIPMILNRLSAVLQTTISVTATLDSATPTEQNAVNVKS